MYGRASVAPTCHRRSSVTQPFQCDTDCRTLTCMTVTGTTVTSARSTGPPRAAPEGAPRKRAFPCRNDGPAEKTSHPGGGAIETCRRPSPCAPSPAEPWPYGVGSPLRWTWRTPGIALLRPQWNPGVLNSAVRPPAHPIYWLPICDRSNDARQPFCLGLRRSAGLRRLAGQRRLVGLRR